MILIKSGFGPCSAQIEPPTRYIFWMVWREGGGAPTARHFSKQAALNEAERLAKLNPGDTFFVLKTTGAVVASEPVIERVKLERDEIPF